MENYAIAVDIGGSSGKMLAARLEHDRLQICDEYVFVNEPVPVLDNLFINVFGIFESIRHGIARFSHLDGRFATIGIDTYGNGYGILDRQGRLIGCPHFYKDRRTEHILDRVREIIPLEELYRQTGIWPARSRVLMQLLCDVLEDAPAIRSGQTFLPLPNLLAYFFTGEKAAERTIASVECLLDPRQSGWNGSLFERLGIPAGLFPRFSEGGSVLGEVTGSLARQLDCGPLQMVTAFCHDTESALVAAPRLDAGKVFASLGTSIIFGTQTSQPVVNDLAFVHRFKNMAGAFGLNSLCKDFPGFWILDRCIAEWRQTSADVSYATLCEEARNAGENKTYVNVGDPVFQLQSDNMIATIQEYCRSSRQPAPETRGAIARCLFESYALYIRNSLACLQEITGAEPYRELVAVNGGVRNALLMQMIADASEIPVTTGSPFASSMGNLLTQFYASGQLSSLAEMREAAWRSNQVNEFEPRPAEKWRQALAFMKSSGLLDR